MSDETGAPLLAALQAFNDEGIDAALEYFDPDIEWWAPPEWLEDRLYSGHTGVRQLAEFWTQQFDEYRVEPSRLIDIGDDRVVALLHQRGRIRGSGDRIEQQVGYIARFRAGKVAEVRVYFSWEATLEAAERV
jgi:ketosteroid isomerase-like protein